MKSPSTPPARAPPRSTASSSILARRNLNASFDLAKSLAGAKNLTDMVELQTAFWRAQFGALSSQAEEVRALSTKVTADTAAPMQAHMARSAEAVRKAS